MVQSGATVAPGGIGIGTLNVAGTLNFNGSNATFDDGSVFTDILRTRKPRRAVAPSETPAPETRRSRHARRVPRLAEVTAGGFVPGEDVAVATIVSHTDATGTGEARTLIDLDDLPDGTHEVILFGRISGTLAVRRLT